MINGLADFSVLQIIIWTLISTHITIISVTVYLHRFSAHRALELHPSLQHFFRFWLWLTTGMTTKAWTAIHRKHHAKCETEDDPHSPQILGLKKLLLEGSELYRAEAKNAETLRQYGKGTPDDWLETHLYSRYDALGISLLLIFNVTLFGPLGLTVWAVQMLWIPILAAGVINGIGHYWGYRNFECADAATNICPWGVLIGGEELHNNHHTYPNSAKLSVQWWEFDIGWLYIQLFSLLGLAQVKKLAPKPKRQTDKKHIDGDTLAAVISNRFQIMAQYRKKVVGPVVNAESSTLNVQLKQKLSKAKALICKNDSIIDERSKAKLNDILDASHALNLVYEFRLKLQVIWEKTSHNKSEMLSALTQWCTEAEETGIKALHDFAQHLKTYTLQPGH